jgi:peptide/nickel transport system substrate-binding protein
MKTNRILKMPYQWLIKPRALLYAPIIAVLSLAAVACGAAATATPPPAAAPEPAAAAPAATAVPAEAAMPAEDMMAEGKIAPSFAEYWQPDTEFYGQPVYGGTLRVNYEDPLEHSNAWGAATGAADSYRGPTSAILVMENPYDAGAPLVPDLAQSWTIHDDLAGVTFDFREGTTWHNGDIFTCEDARFSFETMITAKGITASYMQSRLANVDLSETTCTDDLTLEMRFSGPTGIPLLPLSNRRGQIFNKAWFQAGGEEVMFQDVSVGLGPFKWAEGQSVGIDEQHFEKNPDYYIPELPYVDELVVFGILDESAQQATQLAHQTDWHWVRNFGQYRAYVDHDQIMTVIRATRGNFRLWINARIPPFDNVRVRQAIVMSIDREAAITVLQDGYGASGFFGYAPGSPWDLSQEQGCAVPGWCVSEDMEATRVEVRKILEEEGFDFDESYLFTVESDAQVQARSTFLQEQLRLVGIQTDFDSVETIAYRQQEQSGTWGVFKPGNSTVTADDPNAGVASFLRCDSSGNHWTPNGPCDEEIVALLDQAQTELDFTARKALSDEIQLRAMKTYGSFPVYWEQEAVSFWPEVRGYAHFPAPNGSFLKFMHLWIDPAHKDDTGNKGQTTGVPGGI